jgi:Holliday junction resolvase
MGLLQKPVITKFFSNKIESSLPEWGDYLLEIADIFSTFDGEEFDRDLLTDRFSAISGRSPYKVRDAANFRDEFGAYGTYLGLYHVEMENGKWKIYLSNAAKHFLCSAEPDVESFCRAQMTLFQYPNGAGAVPGRAGMQGNAKKDTIREIQNNIRVNPFRLICKLAQIYHEYEYMPLDAIEIPYKTLYFLMNDDSINTQFSPKIEDIYAALSGYKTGKLPAWARTGITSTNFSRNFHIFDRTGMFKHTRNGLHIADGDTAKIYSYIHAIAEMQHDFRGFESCYGSADIETAVKSVVSTSAWGRYFDSYTMPTQTLQLLSDSITDEQGVLIDELPLGFVHIETQPFPALHDYQSNQIRAFAPSGKTADLFETIIRREKANRDHGRILERIASTIRVNSNNKVFENIFIDLLAAIGAKDFIFEVKSNTTKNALSQIRKAVAQLYEYRYRSGKFGAVLCIVLQEKPRQDWVIDYLVKDRDIMICWLVDELRFECPPECFNALSLTGIV